MPKRNNLIFTVKTLFNGVKSSPTNDLNSTRTCLRLTGPSVRDSFFDRVHFPSFKW